MSLPGGTSALNDGPVKPDDEYGWYKLLLIVADVDVVLNPSFETSVNCSFVCGEESNVLRSEAATSSPFEAEVVRQDYSLVQRDFKRNKKKLHTLFKNEFI